MLKQKIDQKISDSLFKYFESVGIRQCWKDIEYVGRENCIKTFD